MIFGVWAERPPGEIGSGKGIPCLSNRLCFPYCSDRCVRGGAGAAVYSENMLSEHVVPIASGEHGGIRCVYGVDN